MKRNLLIVLFSFGLAYGASAQRVHGGGAVRGHGFYHGGGWSYHPRTYIGLGFGFGYPWGYYPFGGYGPWYAPYPPYYYGYGAMPNQLELQVRDIRNDYAQQIKDVRHDKALTRKERRAKIDELKTDRDNAIVQARHDYFYRSRENFNDRNRQQGQPAQPNQQAQPAQPNQQAQPAQPKSGNDGSSSSEGPEYQEQGSNATGSK